MDRVNNFNLIRLLAAMQVVVFHGIEHLQIKSEWLNFLGVKFLKYFPGVPIFFFISGFLIYWSFERNTNNIGQYFKNRLLRIYPALWVCLIITIFLLLLFSDNTIALLKDKGFYSWVVGQLTFFQFYTPNSLRFWGVGTPNGSLWTIIIELQFYFLIPIIYFLRKKNKLTFYALLLISIFSNILVFMFDSESLLIKLWSVFIAPYLYYFMFGILFYIYWNKVKLLVENKFLIWFLIYILWSYVLNTYFKIETYSYWIDSPINLLSDILLLFVVFSAATSNKKLSNLILKEHDVSYGIYIYHMIVINVFAHLGLVNNIYYLALVFLITTLLGWLSWVLIEKNALKLKNKIRFLNNKAQPS